MLRRTLRRLIHDTTTSDSINMGRMMRDLQGEIHHTSPYIEAFKDYWATPVPWVDRDYGPKPKAGAPVPNRTAATMLVCGYNRHIDPAIVESGEDNDYKVLMMYKEGKGRFQKDQFVFPAGPLQVADRTAEWAQFMRMRGSTKQFPDLMQRVGAMRLLMAKCNIMTIPDEFGGLAEADGPEGRLRWYMKIDQCAMEFRRMMHVMEIDIERTLESLLPFRCIVTPESESIRYENYAYIKPFHKLPEVEWLISTVGEQLIWVSPKEAIKRFNMGIFETATPNIILLAELDQAFERWKDMKMSLHSSSTPQFILPRIVRHEGEKLATVVLPGDYHYPVDDDEYKGVEVEGEDPPAPHLRRFNYEKDEPFGIRAIYHDRPATADDNLEEMEPVPLQLSVEEKSNLLEDIKERERQQVEEVQLETLKVSARLKTKKDMRQYILGLGLGQEMAVATPLPSDKASSITEGGVKN